MSELTQTIQELPVGGLLPVGLLLIVGLMLWAFGRRVLRGGLAIIGFIFGGMFGWLVGSSLGLGVWSLGTALLGGLIAACLMAVAFRMAVAGAMAVIFAVAAPLGVMTWAEFKAARAGQSMDEANFTNPMVDEVSDWLESKDNPEAREQAQAAAKAASESLKQQIDRARSALDASGETGLSTQLAEVGAFAIRLRDAIRAKWDSTPPTLRPTLTVSVIVGGLLGLFIGLLAHSFSAAAITSLGGSLLWLTAVQILAVRFGLPEGPWFPRSGMALIIVWLITSALGVVIQWTLTKRRADKPA